MKQSLILVVFMLGFLPKNNAQEAYKLYNSKGKEVKFSKMLKELSDADVVFFGELHNNSLCHWMELQVLESLFENNKNISVGAEMFEADDQLIVDEYFDGDYKTSNFEKEVKLWDNYKTDYKPLLEFSKDNNLKFVATNVPRRYASMVSSGGLEILDKLSSEAKSYFAPLPIAFDSEVPVYKEMMEMDMGHGGAHMNMENFAKAQAIKDATMAYFISENLKSGAPFIHFNGEFHSKLHSGIIWHLNKYKPGLKIVTISTQEADTLDFDSNYSDQGDFILVIPTDMAKSY
ncbi:MAG: ChaN family lipoprotein [Saprospiraceae bacterium]